MKTLFDPPARQELLDRIGRLTPECSRRWGRMTAAEMVCHLTDERFAAQDPEASWPPHPYFGRMLSEEAVQLVILIGLQAAGKTTFRRQRFEILCIPQSRGPK